MFREMHHGMHQLGLSARENNSNLVKICTCLNEIGEYFDGNSCFRFAFTCAESHDRVAKISLT
jgi:hypothetical protein